MTNALVLSEQCSKQTSVTVCISDGSITKFEFNFSISMYFFVVIVNNVVQALGLAFIG